MREMGCIIHGTSHPDIHHLVGTKQSGMGMKPPDELTIPLCHNRCHMELHQIGHESWEKINGTQKYWLTVTNDKLKSREAMK